ncbi:anti-sigma factor domain-containing protein [Kitasatospora sp. NPDC059327]|uniref:anti-sigma factor n=1 Tax=Kitasatospora sp. NPDC059327 TaxID=3346803 RepID=UPI0036C324B7
MSTFDAHTLSGAHALHALDAAESAAFEEHLAGCPACAQEAVDFAETLARVAASDEVRLPAGMEDRAMAAVAGIRQLAPSPSTPSPPAPSPPALSPPAPAPGRPRRRRGARDLVLAACLALSAVAGVTALQQHDQAERARAAAARDRSELHTVAELVTAPDARARTADSTAGSGTVVWSDTRNQAAFLSTGLAPLPPDRVYELWYIDDAPRPAGLLRDSQGAQVLVGPLDRSSAVAVTQEPAGGSLSPTTDPLLVLRLT